MTLSGRSIHVRLTDEQLARAQAVGRERHRRSEARKSQNRHGFDQGKRTSLEVHLQGACAELAVALVTGLFWDGSIDTFKKGGDVGPLQVRCRSRADWDLPIRSDDDPNAIFVLVTGDDRDYVVVGWIFARSGQRPEWLKRYGGREAAWFVPQSALSPLPIDDQYLVGYKRDRQVVDRRPSAWAERDVRDAAWTIVKDRRGMNDSGHVHAVDWASAYIDAEPRASAPRRPREPRLCPSCKLQHPAGTTCAGGWAPDA